MYIYKDELEDWRQLKWTWLEDLVHSESLWTSCSRC